MKIIREKITNIVKYAGTDLELKEQYAKGPGFKNISMNRENYELLTVDSIPDIFAGNKYTYTANDGWTLIDPDWYDAIAAIQEAAETARTTEAANNRNIKEDPLVTYLRETPLEDIETYVEGRFSGLAQMTDQKISDYVDNSVTNLAQVQGAIKVIAQDVAHSVTLLKSALKVVAWLGKTHIKD